MRFSQSPRNGHMAKSTWERRWQSQVPKGRLTLAQDAVLGLRVNLTSPVGTTENVEARRAGGNETLLHSLKRNLRFTLWRWAKDLQSCFAMALLIRGADGDDKWRQFPRMVPAQSLSTCAVMVRPQRRRILLSIHHFVPYATWSASLTLWNSPLSSSLATGYLRCSTNGYTFA
jgi:hypothetical protein